VVGISLIEQGTFVAERYRVAERLTRFAIADSALTGVEYEYWLALDETRGVEVWLQVAESRGVVASGADLAGVVSALRRLNHPAVPAVLDFGEIEVEVAAEAGSEEDGAEVVETVVQSVGYTVLEPVDAESLATVLLRAALTEAEILAVLVGIADVLKVLHEVELVHGHLSAYSFLLAEHGVLLIDLAAALALETASASELTAAADVYALAWLACIALAGVEAVEDEFGVGFDAGSSPESAAAPQLLTIDLVERRRAWAEANLVATYGVRAELAELLIAALGEAGGRPTVAQVHAALTAREDVDVAAGSAAAGAAAAGAVVAAAVVAEAVEVVEAAEIVEEAEAAQAQAAMAAAQLEEIEVAEVVEAEEAAHPAGAFVGAGVGAGVAVGAEAMAGAGRGGTAVRTGGSGGSAAFGSVPTAPPSTPSTPSTGRHSLPPKRPKSAMYVAIAIVLIIIVAIAWGCAAGSSPSASKPSGSATTGGPAGQASASAGGGGGASASASAGQGAVTPSAGAGESASAGTGTGASASASAAAGGGGATPGYTATPLATAPSSPGQALQQIQTTVSQAESAGQLPSQAKAPLGQAIGTLQHEIAGNSSVETGISQLRSALQTPGVPSGFVTQINELIPYLVTRQGS
jgi:tRNA A-37 threonylcarbamoyl transferase component Bud32